MDGDIQLPTDGRGTEVDVQQSERICVKHEKFIHEVTTALNELDGGDNWQAMLALRRAERHLGDTSRENRITLRAAEYAAEIGQRLLARSRTIEAATAVTGRSEEFFQTNI